MDEKITELLKTLPPITACLVWDVVQGYVTLQTIQLADQASEQEWESYDLVRCIAAGNPEFPPITEAKALVDMMLAEFNTENL